jgi:hypothetical protein
MSLSLLCHEYAENKKIIEEKLRRVQESINSLSVMSIHELMQDVNTNKLAALESEKIDLEVQDMHQRNLSNYYSVLESEIENWVPQNLKSQTLHNTCVTTLFTILHSQSKSAVFALLARILFILKVKYADTHIIPIEPFGTLGMQIKMYEKDWDRYIGVNRGRDALVWATNVNPYCGVAVMFVEFLPVQFHEDLLDILQHVNNYIVNCDIVIR